MTYQLVSDASKMLGKKAVVRDHHGMVASKKGKTKEEAGDLKAALALDVGFPGAEDVEKALAG